MKVKSYKADIRGDMRRCKEWAAFCERQMLFWFNYRHNWGDGAPADYDHCRAQFNKHRRCLHAARRCLTRHAANYLRLYAD